MDRAKRIGFRPKANNERLNSPEIVANVRKILGKYKDVPLYLITCLYKIEFDAILSFVEMGYPEGLPGFLRSLGGMVEFRHDNKGLCHVSLAHNDSYRDDQLTEGKENCPLPKFEDDLHPKRRQSIEALFNPSLFLWTNKRCANLLSKDDIQIEKSGYELACEMYRQRVQVEVAKIRRYLANFPNGIRVSQIDIPIDKRVFNIATSLNALTLELPEVFYRQDCADGSEALVFDGHIHSMDLAQELARTGREAADGKIVSAAINLGVYQKTLLLIRETGLRGLKINVWYSSMTRNFPNNSNPGARDPEATFLDELDPVRYFTALARNSLIVLRSAEHNAKNDLRAFLPEKPVVYMDVKQRNKNLLDFDDISNAPTEVAEKPLLGRQARKLAILLKARENGV